MIASSPILSDHRLSIAAVWSDVDLIEVEVSVRFEAWSGTERGYATRDDLTRFASALNAVATGGTEAILDVGQRDLGYSCCRVFEYGGPRHLGMEGVVGHAGGNVVNRPDYPRELRISIPIERGQLPSFARAIDEIVRTERGEAVRTVPLDWPQ